MIAHMGWIGLGQNFRKNIDWIGLGPKLIGLGWIKKIGPMSNSASRTPNTGTYGRRNQLLFKRSDITISN